MAALYYISKRMSSRFIENIAFIFTYIQKSSKPLFPCRLNSAASPIFHSWIHYSACIRRRVMVKNRRPGRWIDCRRLNFFVGEFLLQMAFTVMVDRKKCNGCEECLEACTAGMFRMQGGKAVPIPGAECMGCETCVGVCEENAVTVTDTRVALSDTCVNLLRALDDEEMETGTGPRNGS
jgi:NAD-dependent dihydropyrimidine dehydrogenase PreA subunit